MGAQIKGPRPSVFLLDDRTSVVWVLLTSEYVEGKTKRCNGFIDPEFGHDEAVLWLVMSMVKNPFPTRTDKTVTDKTVTAQSFIEQEIVMEKDLIGTLLTVH